MSVVGGLHFVKKMFKTTLDVESKLAHLSSCVVTGQTPVKTLVSRPHWLHLQHLAIFQKLHMRVSIAGQNPGERTERMIESIQWILHPVYAAECHVDKRDSYSPSRLHSTLGAGFPLTRHWNSTSWPSTTVNSCIRDVPEITGGAGEKHHMSMTSLH